MPIVTQVLDGTHGKSAVGVRAGLQRADGISWTTIAEEETNADGQITYWAGWELRRGLYRIVIDSDGYFAGLGASSAYPEVTITFRMHGESAKFQIQITLSPYSYSAYLGTSETHPADSLPAQEGAGARCG